MTSKQFYRFECGEFIQADNFEEAKAIFINQLKAETEDKEQWTTCTCLGFNHSINCPEWVMPH